MKIKNRFVVFIYQYKTRNGKILISRLVLDNVKLIAEFKVTFNNIFDYINFKTSFKSYYI